MALDEYSTEVRVKTPRHHIDMGFVNHRRIFTTFGTNFHTFFESKRSRDTDHMSQLWNDHLLVTYALDACRQAGTRTLGEVLQNPKVGDLFCSTEEFLPCPDVYEEKRVTSKLRLAFECDWTVELDYSTKYIVSDTGRMVLAEGHKECLIAGVYKIDGSVVRAHPLVMGAPSFDHPSNRDFGADLMFYGWEWYEINPEDIDEFSGLKEISPPSPDEWQPVMASLPEASVKAAICGLLGDTPQKDWGGELNDHFASTVHLAGERTTAAFLLKGPARFEEMTPRHLGKNADQIFRLAASPGRVLVVQHAHTIGEAVRATLRAFAVNPANPRRYCFMDGRDTYRLLKAYRLLQVQV